MEKWWFLLSVISFTVSAYGQDTQGFISIDCGSTNNFTDGITKLTYTPDDQYIDTGVNANILSTYKSVVVSQTVLNLRSFPSGNRNCYTLRPVIRNSTYLIRAAFFHGNYDSHFNAQLKKPLLFDIYIGASKWRTLNITDADILFWIEAITVSLSESLYVCLVNTGQGTPFISLLEMRPLKSTLYPYVDEANFVDLYGRYDAVGSKLTRYPDDNSDRIWIPMMLNDWTNISTKQKVNSDYTGSLVELPSAVLQTAAIPSAPNMPNIEINWTQNEDDDAPFFVNLHFAEIQQLSAVINAFEIFNLLSVETKMTNDNDTDGMLSIKTQYKVNKGWTGDPCAPLSYSWAGVVCDSTGNSSKIISLNLTGSGLTGSLSSTFSKLQNIEILDLSNNSLNGSIPDFLATMTSLKVLNLSGNSLSCDVPDELKKKSDSGVLLLVNDNKCTTSMSRKTTIPVIGLAIPAVVLVLLMILLIVVFWRRKNMLRVQVQEPNPEASKCEMQLKTQKFTKTELEKIMDNFTNKIGGGGFGGVFSGKLKDGTCVAVKKLSESSKQGHKEFLTEAENLATLHHRNLLALIGYCEEESCVALVYEYMPQGTLEDHIRGNRVTLGWKERLQIALEAAQGLAYMHKGSRMPIVHRDVKCSNILLGNNLEAKVADLGLARAFRSNDQGTVATICGTPGYIDPEFFNSSVLTVKSDVYSFGIVLLEIITGLPPISQEGHHLVNRVRQKLQKEDISSVIDSRFQGNYDDNSVWKVLELAMSCTQKASTQRPTMSGVVAELSECLDLETRRMISQSNRREYISISSDMHGDTVIWGNNLSTNDNGMDQHSMHSENYSVDYKSDCEVMLGPSLR